VADIHPQALMQGDSALRARLLSEKPGPIYLAWVDATETTFGVQHHRLDEDAFAFQITHSEGDFATLSLDVRNPRVGLLGAGRKVWAWLSIKIGVTVVPLLFGRLIGIPTNFFQEVVTLQFQARPADFLALKTALANTLKVLPYWDPAWIAEDKRDDPDTALSARSAFWHIDRVTHAVTISDVLTGEDTLEEFEVVDTVSSPGDVFDGSVSVNLGSPPSRSVLMIAQANWTQTVSAVIDIGDKVFVTYTGKSLIDNWPKPGDDLGGGWTAEESSAVDMNKVDETVMTHFEAHWKNNAKTHVNGDQLTDDYSEDKPSFVGNWEAAPISPYVSGPPPIYLSHVVHDHIVFGFLDPGDTLSDVYGPSEPVNISPSIDVSTMYVPLSRIETKLKVRYTAARARTELVVFNLSANVQSLITLADQDEPARITMSSVDLGLDMLAYGAAALEQPALGSYFPTARGQLSLKYLVLTARAALRFSSRAVDITFATTIERAVLLSCRKSARLHWNKLPGGVATGKITSYTIRGDGDTGEFSGAVTMGCAVGYGGTVAAAAGTPDYVQTGYVQVGYQTYTGAIIALPDADVGVSPPYVTDVVDDGLVFPLGKQQVVLEDSVAGDAVSQAHAIELAFLAETDLAFESQDTQKTVEQIQKLAALKARGVEETLKVNPVSYTLRLKPVDGGPFQRQLNIVTTVLEVPQGINLEATS
jgi:hypothetical protein